MEYITFTDSYVEHPNEHNKLIIGVQVSDNFEFLSYYIKCILIKENINSSYVPEKYIDKVNKRFPIICDNDKRKETIDFIKNKLEQLKL